MSIKKIEIIVPAIERTDFILYSRLNSNILYAPIYLDTVLPRDGWIQGCVICNVYTSNNYFYIDDTYNDIGYMVYCCRVCRSAIDKYEDVKNEYFKTGKV